VIHVRAVTTNYFTVMGIPRREGRAFSSRDTSGSVPVAVVNMAAARRFWPDRNPIGTTVSLDMGSGAQLWHIVGIVADVRSIALSERFWPEIFVPLLQAPSGRLNILLESSMPSQALITATRHVLQSVDPAQPAREIERLETMINRKFDFARFRIWLVSTFAILVIVITVAGIGGLMAEIGQQRSHEVAIRIALGANRRNVFALVIKDMVAPLAGGILIGSFTSWCLSRWAAEVAFGFPNLRLEPLCLIIALFVVIISPAVVFPALQLSRIKPVDMLRYS
jgi:putative ABC transport system permease protein